MKPISTRAHGYLDYTVGALLIAAPWILGFASEGPDTWVPMVLGVGTIIYSLLTNYELAVAHMIPFKTHLVLDAMAGLLLAASPWLFQFADRVWMPHVIVGVIELVVVMLTRHAPDERRIQRRTVVH